MSSENRVAVLIVDDDRGLLRLIEKALRPAGFTTATAASGKEAIQWLEFNRADLMVLDLKLPDYEGAALISELAARGQSLPFIIITGQGDERVAVDMMKRGALDYLVKDNQFLDLVPTVVSRAVAQIERERALKRAEDALRVSEERFRVALKNSPIMVFNQNEELRYTWFHNSPPGFSEEGCLGKTDTDLFAPEEAAHLTEIKAQVLRTGIGAREEIKCTFSEAGHLYDFTIEPVRDASGRIVGITGAAMDVTERKRLEQEISEVSEMEQRRIGQDLHDGICQHLAGIELMSQVLEQNLEKKSKTHAAQAGEIAKHMRETIAQTRSLARGLSPVELEAEGLMFALQELAENSAALFRITCRFTCEKPVLIQKNPVATHLYRIAQEAVSNGIRHGKAKRVDITLSIVGERIHLEVRDNGMGFSKDAVAKGGLGLRIMQYRAGMIGGTATIQSGPSGTIVTCSLPKSAATSNKE